MKIHASGEDYLEAILVLQKKMGMVRSIDLARHMGFSKPPKNRHRADRRLSCTHCCRIYRRRAGL